MIYVYIDNIEHRKKIEYIFNTFFYTLTDLYKFIPNPYIGIYNSSDILLAYISDNHKIFPLFHKVIVILDSCKLFNPNFLKPSSLNISVNRYFFPVINKDIISIFNNSSELYIKVSENYIETNIDIVSDAFFMLSRYEEIVACEKFLNLKDTYSNIYAASARESVSYRNNFLHRPIVNEYIELLWYFIDGFSLGYRRKKNIWSTASFAACLTHDVDTVKKYRSPLNIGKTIFDYIVKYRNIKKAIISFLCYIKCFFDNSYDPHWSFDYLMNMEMQFAFSSSFFFMSGGNSNFDNNYKINNLQIRKLIAKIEENGFEAGYHGSFNSFNNKDLILKEIDTLDAIIRNKPYGCRQHYLRFEFPTTWNLQHSAKILYDTTLGFADHEGFRCGICFPYKPYDIYKDKTLDIWEIPLCVMDATLKDVTLGNYSPEEAMEAVSKIIDIVKEYGGVFTLLWHNSSFDQHWENWQHLYKNILQYLYNSNCVGLSGKNLILQFNRLHS